MKDIKNYICEANESKDKTWKQIRKGDTIYYLECYNSDKNHKIEVATVESNYWHEAMYLSEGYMVPEHYQLEFVRKSKNKKGSAIIWKRDWENKILCDSLMSDGTIFHYISTDRELLAEFQEKLVDEDIKKLEQEIENFREEFESKRKKLQDKMNALIAKKIEKYED
jgi:hypothetical protein